jgi:hypothetical protein
MTYCGFLVPPPDCPVSELKVEEEEEVLVSPPPVEFAEADEFDYDVLLPVELEV